MSRDGEEVTMGTCLVVDGEVGSCGSRKPT